jgi:hypothetical protein
MKETCNVSRCLHDMVHKVMKVDTADIVSVIIVPKGTKRWELGVGSWGGCIRITRVIFDESVSNLHTCSPNITNPHVVP